MLQQLLPNAVLQGAPGGPLLHSIMRMSRAPRDEERERREKYLYYLLLPLCICW